MWDYGARDPVSNPGSRICSIIYGTIDITESMGRYMYTKNTGLTMVQFIGSIDKEGRSLPQAPALYLK